MCRAGRGGLRHPSTQPGSQCCDVGVCVHVYICICMRMIFESDTQTWTCIDTYHNTCMLVLSRITIEPFDAYKPECASS
jgi:hypothetical protein